MGWLSRPRRVAAYSQTDQHGSPINNASQSKGARQRDRDKTKEYIARQGNAKRASRATKPTAVRSIREDTGDVCTVRSLGFDAASVALPADIDLEVRAARMNQFWDKLVDYQHRNVLVIAVCVGDEQ